MIDPAEQDVPGRDSFRIWRAYGDAGGPFELSGGDPFEIGHPRLVKVSNAEGADPRSRYVDRFEKWTPRHPDEVAIVVDLRVPVAPTMRGIESLIQELRQATFLMPDVLARFGGDAKGVARAEEHARLFLRYKQIPRPRPRELITYLRVLDALERNAGSRTLRRELAKAFHPTKSNRDRDTRRAAKSVSDDIRAARRYRDGDWRLLLLASAEK